APAAPGAVEEDKLHIDASDAVGAAMASDRAGRAGGPDWAALLLHARTLNATAPSRKWLSEAARLVGAIKAETFDACVSDWFNCAGKPAPGPRPAQRHAPDPTLLNDCSVDWLKGLCWAVVAAGRARLAPALGTLAEACFKKV